MPGHWDRILLPERSNLFASHWSNQWLAFRVTRSARERTLTGCRTEVISVANDDCGADEHDQAERNQPFRTAAGALPFFEGNAPQRTKYNDAGHVKSPTRELVPPHLRLAHGVEKELHIPGGAGKSAEEVVAQHGRSHRRFPCNRNRRCHLLGRCVGHVLENGLDVRARRTIIADLGMKILVPRAVANVQVHTPDEVRG